MRARCASLCSALLALVFLPGVATAADLTLAIEPRWSGSALGVPSAAVNNQHGQTLRFTRLAGLISGVALERADGSVVRLDGQYGFIDAESGRLAPEFHRVPEGDYTGLEFQIGLPPEINYGEVSQWPAGHPLNPLMDGLHWSWQGGYVFLALEGRWQSGANSAVAQRGFSYHLATDVRRMTLRFRANYHVGAAATVRLAFDLARVLGAQELRADDGSESTHSAVNDPRAATFAAAVQRAWFWLDVTPRDVGVAGMADAGPDATSAVASTTPFAFVVPKGFPQPTLPADNALTAEGVALGEKLFRDVRLSGNGTQSCASCHAPDRAFSDSVALSRGAGGAAGTRNAMPLLNLAWNPAFAWDGSQPRVRDQALAAMTNPREMQADAAAVAATLSRDAGLAADFARVFGSAGVTSERVGLALEQYLLAQVSADSRFDRALRGEVALTEEEKRGFELFVTEYDPAHDRRGADCFHCHGGALFSDYAFKDNGLGLAGGDRGRERVTEKATDRAKFKTPSLRNVALTAPYMHDGRFTTLEDVIAHYDHGVKRTANLDPNLAKHPDEGLQLSAEDQRALVAFLRTLTDGRFQR